MDSGRRFAAAELRVALEACENDDVRSHIREAIQFLETER